MAERATRIARTADLELKAPITRQQEVTNKLRELVLAGAFPPGTRLQEVALSDAFGVSRTPLRAALTVLGEEGLLTYEPNCGYEVSRVDISEVLDSYDVRGTLEGMACRLCAERGIADSVSRQLAACLDDGDAIATANLAEEEAFLQWRKINAQFHETILVAANNRCLREATERTMRFPFVSQWVGRWNDPQRYKMPQQGHRAVYDAIIKGEAVRAEALMREHVYQAKAMVRTVLSSLDSAPPIFESHSGIRGLNIFTNRYALGTHEMP